ncbi:hypothetical protein QAD02_011594 [Eretmocerus hayati]|uniref:Uncharacterized protein n=1 Tax=Eretmocerus hayati TaxID=131215 RepID=A0ACC2NY69_9HYME|nr:hypothetical protein QAD02_011594 [Eretmocerus hayati]
MNAIHHSTDMAPARRHCTGAGLPQPPCSTLRHRLPCRPAPYAFQTSTAVSINASSKTPSHGASAEGMACTITLYAATVIRKAVESSAYVSASMPANGSAPVSSYAATAQHRIAQP